MDNVKKPKKPLIFYYCMVLVVIILFNSLLMPRIARRSIEDVDYGTFMSMTESRNIGKVDIQPNQILFTDRDNTAVYRTGVMNDPDLAERLHRSGAEFTPEIIEEASPILTFLLSWILPIAIFWGLGHLLT